MKNAALALCIGDSAQNQVYFSRKRMPDAQDGVLLLLPIPLNNDYRKIGISLNNVSDKSRRKVRSPGLYFKPKQVSAPLLAKRITRFSVHKSFVINDRNPFTGLHGPRTSRFLTLFYVYLSAQGSR